MATKQMAEKEIEERTGDLLIICRAVRVEDALEEGYVLGYKCDECRVPLQVSTETDAWLWDKHHSGVVTSAAPVCESCARDTAVELFAEREAASAYTESPPRKRAAKK